MSEQTFRELTISGSPEERGNAHGDAMAAEIESTIDFYASIFKMTSAEVFDRARHFRRIIRDYNPAYSEEIEGIAAGAQIREPLWIYALNARSEILALNASADVNECTSLCFQPTAILGQNWDWGRPIEKLAFLMQIVLSEDHTIQMLTEPGIIGKIGMNTYGIGVCLNILRINKPLDGVPIHIVLRSILESQTLEEAKLAIQKSGQGKGSNILFGDSEGTFYDIEFAGDESFLMQPQDPYMIHTNHYLASPINSEEEPFCSSYARLRVANDKASTFSEFTVETMKTILADRSHCELPICCEYKPHADVQMMGTVATVVMDLKAQQMHIRKGNIEGTKTGATSANGKISAEGFTNDFGIAFKNDDTYVKLSQL